MNKLTTAATPKKEPAINIEQRRLESAVEELAAALGQLEQRLGPVLMMNPPTVAGPEKEPSACCPLAEWLRGVTQKVHSMREGVDSMFHRCELG